MNDKNITVVIDGQAGSCGKGKLNIKNYNHNTK